MLPHSRFVKFYMVGVVVQFEFNLQAHMGHPFTDKWLDQLPRLYGRVLLKQTQQILRRDARTHEIAPFNLGR
jgi:hypothetical protein